MVQATLWGTVSAERPLCGHLCCWDTKKQQQQKHRILTYFVLHLVYVIAFVAKSLWYFGMLWCEHYSWYITEMACPKSTVQYRCSYCSITYLSKEGFSPASKASCSSLTSVAWPGCLKSPTSINPCSLMKSTHCSTTRGAMWSPYRRSYSTVSSSRCPNTP